jgi:hypothetical protein
MLVLQTKPGLDRISRPRRSDQRQNTRRSFRCVKSGQRRIYSTHQDKLVTDVFMKTHLSFPSTGIDIPLTYPTKVLLIHTPATSWQPPQVLQRPPQLLDRSRHVLEIQRTNRPTTVFLRRQHGFLVDFLGHAPGSGLLLWIQS